MKFLLAWVVRVGTVNPDAASSSLRALYDVDASLLEAHPGGVEPALEAKV